MKKATRKKINRSGKMPCNICNEKHILVEHHIRGRKIPNPNHFSNLCYICGNCHNNVHDGRIIIEDWVNTSAGLNLIWHKPNEESFTGKNAQTYLVGGKTTKGTT